MENKVKIADVSPTPRPLRSPMSPEKLEYLQVRPANEKGAPMSIEQLAETELRLQEVRFTDQEQQRANARQEQEQKKQELEDKQQWEEGRSHFDRSAETRGFGSKDPEVAVAASSVSHYEEHKKLRDEIQQGVTPERSKEIAQQQELIGGDLFTAHREMCERVGALSGAQLQQLRENHPQQARLAEAQVAQVEKLHAMGHAQVMKLSQQQDR